MELRTAALRALQLADPAAKAAAARALHPAPDAALDTDAALQADGLLPGRTARPPLVAPADVPRRTPFTPEGRAALLHAVAHIELNAINLALDAVWRFPAMPADYYRDWLRVAAEEALHFTLLNGHLATLGHGYGDFAAHDGLWTMAERTSGDLTARMALVPRTLEARGLDATPPMQERLRRAGRPARGGHPRHHPARRDRPRGGGQPLVPLAVRTRGGSTPWPHYATLAARHRAPRLRGPFNLAARSAAGFTETELAALDSA